MFPTVSTPLRASNGLLSTEPVVAYVPIDGIEVRTLVFDGGDGKAYAKRPGADAGIIAVDPSTVYIIGR